MMKWKRSEFTVDHRRRKPRIIFQYNAVDDSGNSWRIVCNGNLPYSRHSSLYSYIRHGDSEYIGRFKTLNKAKDVAEYIAKNRMA